MKTAEEWTNQFRLAIDEDYLRTDTRVWIMEIIEAIRQEQREACYEAFSRIEDLEDQGSAMLMYDNWREMMRMAILTAGTEEYEKAWNKLLADMGREK